MTIEIFTSILLVEYEDTMRGLLYDWLRLAFPDHQIISAPNIDEAIAVLDSSSPEVILVDVDSSEGDVVEVMARFNAAAPETEVVAMTTKSYPAYCDKVVSAGAGACVNRWHICQELRPVLTALLGENGDGSDQPGRRVSSVADKQEMYKVVYIEDDPETLYFVKSGLERSGLELVAAEGGRAGLDAIRRVKPNLILLDLMMPQVSGWDVYHEVRADDEMRSIPILLVTALEQHCDEVRSLDVYGHITKPFTMKELLRTVRSALEMRTA